VTRTRDFGSSNRENHDSSRFYKLELFNSLGFPDELFVENEFPSSLKNQIVLGDIRFDDRLVSSCVDLVVTSPPYNVGKEYDVDYSLGDYLEFLRSIFKRVYDVLRPGGRVCLNLANVGRRPYIPLTDAVSFMMQSLGFRMRGEIIWSKSASVGSSTAWGSWKSPSNPTLRDIHEYILVFSKGDFKHRKRGTNSRSLISRDEFLEYTKSIWSFKTESAKRIGHPAPFPLELPLRCIKLYAWSDDVVLDPFAGSGTTLLAAKQLGCVYLGYEVVSSYVDLAKLRLSGDS